MSRVLPILFNTEMVRAILDERKTVTRRAVKYKYSNTEMKMHTNKCGTKLIEIQKDVEGETHGKYPDGRTWHKLLPYIQKEPPYHPGDILYVRETFFKFKNNFYYMADGKHEELEKLGLKFKWRPSIHMPKEAARIWLRVTDVRVERLQDITEEQAIREGIKRLYDDLSDAEYIAWTKKTGAFPKGKEEWGYKNYLWHGNFGTCGTGNKMSDAWEYQYSSYDSAIDSFYSLWNTTVPLKEWDTYGCDVNPWVWVIEFERCEKPEE